MRLCWGAGDMMNIEQFTLFYYFTFCWCKVYQSLKKEMTGGSGNETFLLENESSEGQQLYCHYSHSKVLMQDIRTIANFKKMLKAKRELDFITIQLQSRVLLLKEQLEDVQKIAKAIETVEHFIKGSTNTFSINFCHPKH